ncbi:MAG TPA: PAS domain S-box protein [Thermoanaerobaculia bacterium]|jgi:PAS domain S-box-containing protein|nr:PAS domain S-box protein [Thermoanaerobaculia bacterium]
MTLNDDEERALRSVALQNAEAILVARQQADRLLAAERERLRIILDSIGEGVISTDADGRVTYLNRVAEVLTGWTQTKAVGRPLPEVFQVIDVNTREPAENPALKALREGIGVGLRNHTLLVARDGSERPIEDSASSMLDEEGNPVGVVLIFRDVSERQRAEEAQARLAAIVESSQDAIISKTLDSVIRTWNTGAERLFGFRAEEVIGRPITLIMPPERLNEEQEILARLARGEVIEHFETVRMTKDGRRIDISLTVSPIRDAQGRIVGASKVARDVTERKQAEEALREADRRKDEFLALLAHELRNPLAPLRNGIEIIRLASDNPAAITEAREVMDRQLSHMVRLIDDLLDISRISRNKMELRRCRVLLADVISSAVETARPALEAAGHELTVSLPPEPIPMDADLTRLAQVFGNLLHNSVKFTQPGGHIWVTALREGDQIAVAVKDTGIGIPAVALPDIFDLFSQVDRSIERSTGGLGIGLALVKGLVEMHGGTVDAASPGKDRGSTFIVRLPVLKLKALSSPAALGQREPDSAGSQRRILVVDDNRDSAASMAMMLKLLGNEVRTAYDGIEAVEVAEQFAPKAVLMDIGMPRLNGYEATRRIRGQPWGRDMAVIALTGWGQEMDRAKAKEAGCDGHLVKPVSLTDLESLLSSLQDGDAG